MVREVRKCGMYQDISPHKYNNSFFYDRPYENGDFAICCSSDGILMEGSEEEPQLPKVSEILQPDAGREELQYLLSVDGTGFYMPRHPVAENGACTYRRLRLLEKLEPAWLAFGAATGAHLSRWYSTHRYCGCCGAMMEQSRTERALVCPVCGFTEYPRISPCVIVAVTSGDRILLTRYAHRGYRKHHALVAGFVEIGETFEDTVRREVMEEVGLKVRNIRYYRSQPWAFSEAVMAGFYAEADGDPGISLNYDGSDELAEARWFTRGELEQEDSTFSLTWTMIQAFRDHREYEHEE